MSVELSMVKKLNIENFVFFNYHLTPMVTFKFSDSCSLESMQERTPHFHKSKHMFAGKPTHKQKVEYHMIQSYYV